VVPSLTHSRQSQRAARTIEGTLSRIISNYRTPCNLLEWGVWVPTSGLRTGRRHEESLRQPKTTRNPFARARACWVSAHRLRPPPPSRRKRRRRETAPLSSPRTSPSLRPRTVAVPAHSMGVRASTRSMTTRTRTG
jgi:hypothetical protein